jgi:hypothetical protein
MTSIYGHEGRFLDDFRALDPGRRRVARRALRWIEASPRPDGVAKREASAYPGTGLILAIYEALVIAYVLDGDVVLFLRVQERADLHEDAT